MLSTPQMVSSIRKRGGRKRLIGAWDGAMRWVSILENVPSRITDQKRLYKPKLIMGLTKKNEAPGTRSAILCPA